MKYYIVGFVITMAFYLSEKDVVLLSGVTPMFWQILGWLCFIIFFYLFKKDYFDSKNLIRPDICIVSVLSGFVGGYFLKQMSDGVVYSTSSMILFLISAFALLSLYACSIGWNGVYLKRS
ncbi:MAG: hypothetical protein ACRCX1_09515 [Bacteroidales bacterium]